MFDAEPVDETPNDEFKVGATPCFSNICFFSCNSSKIFLFCSSKQTRWLDNVSYLTWHFTYICALNYGNTEGEWSFVVLQSDDLNFSSLILRIKIY